MMWTTADLRMLLAPAVAVPDGVTARETEDPVRAWPIFHLSDGRTVRRNPAWDYRDAATKWLVELSEAEVVDLAAALRASVEAAIELGRAVGRKPNASPADEYCGLCGDFHPDISNCLDARLDDAWAGYHPDEHGEHDCSTAGCQ